MFRRSDLSTLAGAQYERFQYPTRGVLPKKIGDADPWFDILGSSLFVGITISIDFSWRWANAPQPFHATNKASTLDAEHVDTIGAFQSQ